MWRTHDLSFVKGFLGTSSRSSDPVIQLFNRCWLYDLALCFFLLWHDLTSSRIHQTITSETNNQMMCSSGIQTVEDSSLREKGISTAVCRYHCGGHAVLRLDDGMVNMTAMCANSLCYILVQQTMKLRGQSCIFPWILVELPSVWTRL